MQITLTISNKLVISPLPRVVAEAVKPLLTMENPKWHQNNRAGYSNRGVPKEIRCWRQGANRLEVPRGFARELIRLLGEWGFTPVVNDLRRSFPPLGLEFQGQLKAFQDEAQEAILEEDFGVLCSPTRSGKTVMSLSIATRRDQPFTVIVHTRELVDQWVERTRQFLGITPGVVASGKFNMGREATVALIQTLYKNPRMVAERTGFLIIDEVHRCPARTFLEAVIAFDCRYMLGPSATPYRADGLTNLIHWHVGPQIHEVDRRMLEDLGAVLRPLVVARETGFTTDIRLAPPWCSENFDPNKNYGTYGGIITAMISDPERNAMVVTDAIRESESGTCLMITDRKEHAREMTRMAKSMGHRCECLVGDADDREGIVSRLNSGESRLVTATGQLLGEGFDCRELYGIFLAMPIKAGKTDAGGVATRLIQYVGRPLTPKPGKPQPRIYDYLDPLVPSLMRAWRSRHREYKKLGWQVVWR